MVDGRLACALGDAVFPFGVNRPLRFGARCGVDPDIRVVWPFWHISGVLPSTTGSRGGQARPRDNRTRRPARMEGDMTERADVHLTGGCQCGAVRYALATAPEQVNVCHCRMCEKASGGPLMTFARVKKPGLRWTRGAPASFRSSSLVERHFCAACGTPLTYNFIERPYISVTLGSLDNPEAIKPELQYSVDRMLSWFPTITSLPGKRTDALITPDLARRFESYQHPDHDT